MIASSDVPLRALVYLVDELHLLSFPAIIAGLTLEEDIQESVISRQFKRNPSGRYLHAIQAKIPGAIVTLSPGQGTGWEGFYDVVDEGFPRKGCVATISKFGYRFHA